MAVYRVAWDGPIRHQDEEIAWGAFMSREDLDARLANCEFVPDGLEIYRHLERQGWL